MDLEEHSIEPLIKRRSCEVCGVALTEEEIRAALESDGRFLCTVHASEEVPLDDEELESPG
ncbi:hypothetical protein JDY09_00470 [Thermoleophilum album]|jgi:hypothetical protein|uniref:hypothetical protein n=1 Tax=Thermoleophilum album TaxID=29539 RepID=UPI000CADA528|nr:hypothetical protein [Thermoleophilum album]MCL6440949.1 hypothetical protein [Thermoleophilum sp.]WDT93775.1 hypothetical protein JDY09_00470 [Thermoleophilum album]GBD45250.1 hypothetical protein HRbin41_00050 [bacterium HR41]